MISLLFAFLTLGQTPEPIGHLLLEGGPHLVTQDKVKAGDPFWGVFQEGSIFTLRPCKISLSPQHHAAFDDPGEMSGTSVSSNINADSLFLIGGLVDPQEGPMLTVFRGNFEFVPDSKITLVKDDIEPEQIRFVRKESGLVLELQDGFQGGQHISTLISYTESKGRGTPVLMWAGDIDRDGNLDYLLDLPETNENYIRLCLYLSSHIGKGQVGVPFAVYAEAGC